MAKIKQPMAVENFNVVILVNIYLIISTFEQIFEDSSKARLVTGISVEDYLEREGYIVKRQYTTTNNELNEYGLSISYLVKTFRDKQFFSITERYFPRVDVEKFVVSVNILNDKHMEIRIMDNEIKFSD